jgi:hypothetical protein
MRRLTGTLAAAAWVCAVACGRNSASPQAQVAPAGDAVTVASPNALVYMCPMDRDIRGHAPGKCPRCGMTLVTSIPDPVEYRVDLTTDTVPRPNLRVKLLFEVFDPWKDNPVKKFSVVHEKLFHAFVVSRDLTFFEHGHPEWDKDRFALNVTFPKPGMYRVLSDFYPEASTPQLIAKTVIVGGPEQAGPSLQRDYTDKQDQNVRVQFATNPAQPIAGTPTRLILTISPGDGLQRYLGVWAHMLAASDDLIDLMHTHPLIADGGPGMQFDVVFPRPRPYRLWVQLQRNGVINTVHFDVPVHDVPRAPVVAAGAVTQRRHS